MRAYAAVGLMAVLAAPGIAATPPASMLDRLTCIDTRVVNLGSDPNALGLTDDLLDAAIKVGVKSEMLGTRVGADCGDALLLTVNSLHDGSDLARPSQFAASVRLELRRTARLVGGAAEGPVTVWDQSSLLFGLAGDAQKSVLEDIEILVRAFVDARPDAGRH